MAKDGITYSDAVRAAAAEAASALGTSPEAVRPRAIRARRQRAMMARPAFRSSWMRKRTRRRLAKGLMCSRPTPER
jgi:hypothetical protein